MDNDEKSRNQDKGNFWTTLPGIITALATLITALAGLIAGLHQINLIVPKAEPSTPLPSPSPSTTPSPSILPGTSSCLQQFLQDIPQGRVATIESGAQGVEVIRPDQPIDRPVAILLKDNGTSVSAIKFQFYLNNQFFKIQSVVDAQCHPVEDYRNTTRGGDKHVLENWDNWKVQLGTGAYTIRLGYDSDSIEASVNRSPPTP